MKPVGHGPIVPAARPRKPLIVLLLLALAGFVLTVVRAEAGQMLYLASEGDRIIVGLMLDDTGGELQTRFNVDLPGHPGPLAFSPDASIVYAALTGMRDNRAGIATLARAGDGSLTLQSTSPITSRTPYIRCTKDGRYLLAAHYGEGDVTVYRITDGLCTSELVDQHTTERTAHCIELDPSGRFAFVPHTTPNRVYQFRFDPDSGRLFPNDPPFVTGPEESRNFHQPRHYVHHPILNVAYTSNERGGGITAWAFDPGSGTLTRRQTLSSLPPDYTGRRAAADIHLTPNGRFAYVSNRDVTQRGAEQAMQDTLTGFALDQETGEIQLIGHFATAHVPRSFCIDRTGRFLYSAGKRSAELDAYRIDQRSGALQQFATYSTNSGPVWVMCGHVE